MPSHALTWRRLFASIGACAATALVWLAQPAAALTINITDPNPTYEDSQAPCPVGHAWCGVTAHLSTTPISASDNLYFDDAFSRFNRPLGLGEKWTIIDGGALDATLNVEIFDAHSFHTAHGVGGVEIQIDFVYDGADRDDFVWSQGLRLNYVPGPNTGTVPPYDSMDTAALSNLVCDPSAVKSPFGPGPAVWCGPVYPYQYTNEKFYDFPKAPYDDGFFEADAMLSKVDYDRRELTLYGGVHYGFYLSVVSEPPMVGIVVMALVMVWSVRRRSASARRAA